jgi:hypothetical protein
MALMWVKLAARPSQQRRMQTAKERCVFMETGRGSRVRAGGMPGRRAAALAVLPGVDVGSHTQSATCAAAAASIATTAPISVAACGGYQFGSSELFGLKQHNALELGVFGFGHARSLIQAGAPDFTWAARARCMAPRSIMWRAWTWPRACG